MNIRREYKYVHRWREHVTILIADINRWAAEGWMIVKFDPEESYALMERELKDVEGE